MPQSRYFRARSRPHFFTDLNLSSILEPADPSAGSFVASKVIATLGPACHDVDTLAQLLEAGMTVARVDLTWGPIQYHKASLANLQAAMKRVHRMCAVMVDTLGREMLIKRSFKLGPDGWPIHDSPVRVSAGTVITITTRDEAATATTLPITYPKFPSLVLPDDIVYIGRYMSCGAPEQGSLYLRVLQVLGDQGDVVCRALNDAELHGLLTVFNLERSQSELVGLQSDLPVLTEYDKAALRDLADEGYELDFLCISYTRSGADVREVRSFVESVPGLAGTAIAAKVETRQALFNFRGILDTADAIVISRGLLGLDCVPEKVALIQKSLISACNLMGKPAVVTRVLDSMTDSPRPTRAEATDVANAVLDGADCLMLGAETLRGRFPLATVRTLVSICHQAEKVFDFKHHFEWLMQSAMDAQELRDALASGGFGGGGLDDDDSRTELLGYGSVAGGLGGLGGAHGLGSMASMSGLGGMGLGGYGTFGSSVAAGLSGLAGGSSADVGSYLPPGGGVGGVGGGGAAHNGGGLSPASTSTTALDELAAAGGGADGGGGGMDRGSAGGGGMHVSFASLPPRPPNRSRSTHSIGEAAGAAAGQPPHPHPLAAGGGSGALSPANQTPGASRSQSFTNMGEAARGFPGEPGSTVDGPPPSQAGRRHHHHRHHAGHASGRASPSARSTTGTLYGGGPSGPYMGKLESVASSAVRAAEKVGARLIVCYTHTSRTAALVAKYRPPMPILTLVVPRLKSDGLRWRLEGRNHARQCLLVRGLLPMLSAPGPSGDEVLEEAIATSSKLGLVGPGHHVVVVERVHDSFCVKIVAVDELGLGIQRDAPATPASVVVRAMVPATPVVGRTLSMMAGESRLPAAAVLAAAVQHQQLQQGRGGSGGGAPPAAPSSGATAAAAGGANYVTGVGPIMGSITSLLAPTMSSIGYGVDDGATAAANALAGLGTGGRPRRQTSRELIENVAHSPFSGSPPVGVGLKYTARGAAGAPGQDGPGAAAGGAGAAGGPDARMGLLHSLLAAADPHSSPQQQGGAAAASGPATSPGGAAHVAAGPVINAIGGGLAAYDGLAGHVTSPGGGGAEAAAGGGGGGGSDTGMSPGAKQLGQLARSVLGAVTEEPEGHDVVAGGEAGQT